MQRKAAMGLIALFVLIAGVLLWLARDKQEAVTEVKPPPVVQGQTAQDVAMAIEKSKTDTRFKTGIENMPKSLSDTEVDGALEVDAAGNLMISRSIRQVFDYFLSAIGEEDLTTIISRIRAHIRYKLPAKAAAQAEQILDSASFC